MEKTEMLYAATHEWTHLADDGDTKVATIGLTAHAIEALTDLVYMDLPEVGRSVAAGDEFGEVESVKAVSPLYSPVDGEVVEVHSDLPDNLEKLNEDPFGIGWIAKIRLSSEDGLQSLMDHAAYQKQCADAG